MEMHSMYLLILLIAMLILWRRIRSMYRPIKGVGIRLLLPILYITPAFALILNPNAHLMWMEVMIAIIVGVILSLPLIWTTRYEMREDHQIYAKKDPSFILAFLLVLAIRFVLRGYFNDMSPDTLLSLFMIVLMSYAIPWRIISFAKFRNVYKGGTQGDGSSVFK